MNKFKISTRLIALIGMLSALLVAIGAVGLVGIEQSNAALKTVYEDRTVPMSQLAAMEASLLESRLAIADAIDATDPAVMRNLAASVDTVNAQADQQWKAYMATWLTPEESQLAARFAADRAALLRDGVMPAALALRGGDVQAARLAGDKIAVLYGAARAGVEALLRLQLREAEQHYQQAVERYAVTRVAAIGAIAAGVLLAVVSGMALVRGMSRALDEAVGVSNAIAAGDLTREIRVRGNDEVAQLLKALSAMQRSLAHLVGQVRGGTEAIASATSQIAAGNADLSRRTEQQAGVLEETASSMEQFTSTAQGNADHAREASSLAVSASAIAVEGGAVVAQVVDTMGAIHDSARKIGDITAVIDGLAFQTNILALNAAVEAARAGEEGRGFAVVASEVRTLAQRSAAAAREIRTLIAASEAQVESGARLAAGAGATMRQVVESIQRVTQVVAEIAAASREQTDGIGQVNQAVAMIDEATQQNAALVEQAAAAAGALHEQAAGLSQLVAVFQLAPAAAADGVTANAMAATARASKAAAGGGPAHLPLASATRAV